MNKDEKLRWSYEIALKAFIANNNLKVGDAVRVAKPKIIYKGWANSWVFSMDKQKKGIIHKFTGDSINVTHDDGESWGYPFNAITKL